MLAGSELNVKEAGIVAVTTIALHVEPDTLGAVDASIALPLALAEAHSAHVAALVFAASVYRPEPPGGDAEMPETELAAHEDGVLLHVRAALETRGLRFEVRGRSSFAYGFGEVLADQMRVSDLGVMSFGSGADIGKRFVANGGIFSSGRPMLLVPPSHAAAAALHGPEVGLRAVPRQQVGQFDRRLPRAEFLVVGDAHDSYRIRPLHERQRAMHRAHLSVRGIPGHDDA